MELSCLALATAVVLSAAPHDSAPGDPRAILREARLAVEGDSAGAVRARWAARLATDSTDRAALLGLATLARLTYDYGRAWQLYRRLTAGPADRFAMYARLGHAQGLDEFGQAREVDRLLSQALADARTLGDRSGEGEALLSLAYARARSQDLETAVAMLDTAVRVVPEEAVSLRAAVLCRRAHLLVLTGAPRAEAELEAAARLARGVEEPRAEGPCVRGMAIAQVRRGQADSAVALYATYAEKLRRVHDRSGRALALAWRAVQLWEELGAFGEARETLREARADADASRHLYAKAVVELFLGQLSLVLNDHRAARGYMDRAVAAAEVVADSEALMVARSWRALVSLSAGDLERARRETLETVGYFQRQGDLENQAEVAKTLANIAMREGDWDAAERELDRSESLLRRLRTTSWRYEQPLERGRLALFRGDLPAAERGFTRYLAGLDSAAYLKRFEAQTYLADTYARRGAIARAEGLLDSASTALDRWRSTLSDRGLRIAAFQAASAAQNDKNASVARVLAALAAGGRTDAAFALAERRRARELRDRMVRDAALEQGRTAAAGRDSMKTTPELRPAELLSDDSTALLEYVTGALGAPTTAFLVTRAAPAMRAWVLAPADSVTGAIGRFVALVAKGETAGEEAGALARLLVEPLLTALPPGITRLVIVPDGPLHRVPWDALRLADGRYLAERYAVGIVPSATTLAVLRTVRRSSTTGSSRLLVFGDPAFTSDTGGYSALFARAGGLPRLRASGREARDVARYGGAAEVRLREDASEEYLVRSPLSEFEVVHFATHALVDDRALDGTALALAPGGGEDGFVTPGELASLHLSADMVVLSACRTAGGVVVDGEGIQGLTAPLLQAGARSVVATAWQVGDRSAARFIDRFYRELAAGKAVVEALRLARLQSIRAGEPPRVWAAFVVVGDPLATVPLKEKEGRPTGMWWIAAAGVLLLAATIRVRTARASAARSSAARSRR